MSELVSREKLAMARWESGEEDCGGSPGIEPGDGEALVGGGGFGISRGGYSPCSARNLASNCSARWRAASFVQELAVARETSDWAAAVWVRRAGLG
ncbi:MAG: hypothetical protein U1G07_19700 [Verrucomicrobiota bacterium]